MEASRFVEQKYGLVATAATGRAGAAKPTRGEQRKHRDTRRRCEGEGRPAPTDRELLRRQVRIAAAGASSQREVFSRLRADGLLVRERMSERTPGEVTGYAVALPDRYRTRAAPVYFGGGKLAPDLTCPGCSAAGTGRRRPRALRWGRPSRRPAGRPRPPVGSLVYGRSGRTGSG